MKAVKDMRVKLKHESALLVCLGMRGAHERRSLPSEVGGKRPLIRDLGDAQQD